MGAFSNFPQLCVLIALGLTLGGVFSHKISNDRGLTYKQSKWFYEAAYFQLYLAILFYAVAFVSLVLSAFVGLF